MSEPTPADVLRQAAEVIRERGWCTGILLDSRGRVCAAGAIRQALVATKASAWMADVLEAFRVLVAPATQARSTVHVGMDHPIAIWNDTVALDGEDVAQHMEKAAALYEETAGLADSSSTAGAYPAAPPRL